MHGRCIPCFLEKYEKPKRLSRIRMKVTRAFSAAPERAVIRLIKDDPDLFNIVVKRAGELKIKRYIYEEKKKIFAECRHNSIKFLGNRPGVNDDIPECWDIVYKEIFG